MTEIETFPTLDTWAASIAGRIEETLGAAVVDNLDTSSRALAVLAAGGQARQINRGSSPCPS